VTPSTATTILGGGAASDRRRRHADLASLQPGSTGSRSRRRGGRPPSPVGPRRAYLGDDPAGAACRPCGWSSVHLASHWVVPPRGRPGREQRRKGEGEAQRKQLRAVVPVGSRELALEVLRRILPEAPLPERPAPRRVLLKSPLRYRFLSWGLSETCVVARTGRIQRVTSWVPLAKVQSFRRAQWARSSDGYGSPPSISTPPAAACTRRCAIGRSSRWTARSGSSSASAGPPGALRRRSITLPGAWGCQVGRCGLSWEKVVEKEARKDRLPRCFLASTNTPSTTKTVSRFRPASGRLCGGDRRDARHGRCLFAYTPQGLEHARPGPARYARSAEQERPPDAALSSTQAPRRRSSTSRAGRYPGRVCWSTRSSAGTSSSPVSTTTLEILGSRRVAARARRGRRECGALLRTSCSQARLIMFPFSPRRCASRSPCTRGRPSSTRPSAQAVTRALIVADLQGSGKLIAIDRDPTVRTYFERLEKRAGVNARLLRGDFGVSPAAARGKRRAGRRGSCSTSVCPRCS